MPWTAVKNTSAVLHKEYVHFVTGSSGKDCYCHSNSDVMCHVTKSCNMIGPHYMSVAGHGLYTQFTRFFFLLWKYILFVRLTHFVCTFLLLLSIYDYPTNTFSTSDSMTCLVLTLTINVGSDGVEAGDLSRVRGVAPEDIVLWVHTHTTVPQVLLFLTVKPGVFAQCHVAGYQSRAGCHDISLCHDIK